MKYTMINHFVVDKRQMLPYCIIHLRSLLQQLLAQNTLYCEEVIEQTKRLVLGKVLQLVVRQKHRILIELIRVGSSALIDKKRKLSEHLQVVEASNYWIE